MDKKGIRGKFYLIFSVVILFSIFFVLTTMVASEGGGDPKYVCAHYLARLNASDDIGIWGNYTEEGMPEIGLYDSWNETVLRIHLDQAVAADIDCLLVSWFGWGYWRWNQTDDNYQILFNITEEYNAEHNTSIKLAISYDHQVSNESLVNESLVNYTVNQFKTLLDRDADRPEYLRIDDKPVIFLYHDALKVLNYTTWKSIRNQLNKDGYSPYFIADPSFVQESWGVSFTEIITLFQGLYIFNPIEISMMDDGDFMGNYTKMSEWYNNLSNVAHLNNVTWVPTAIPGFNNTNSPGAQTMNWTYSYPRLNSITYKQTLNASIGSNPDNIVLVISFNGWDEDHQIEPSTTYGDKYINITRNFAQKWRTM